MRGTLSTTVRAHKRFPSDALPGQRLVLTARRYGSHRAGEISSEGQRSWPAIAGCGMRDGPTAPPSVGTPGQSSGGEALRALTKRTSPQRAMASRVSHARWIRAITGAPMTQATTARRSPSLTKGSLRAMVDKHTRDGSIPPALLMLPGISPAPSSRGLTTTAIGGGSQETHEGTSGAVACVT